MVRNYRNINDDVRVIIKLAKLRIAEEAREARYRDDPRQLIAQVESKREAIKRLESAIKS